MLVDADEIEARLLLFVITADGAQQLFQLIRYIVVEHYKKLIVRVKQQ